MYCGRYGEVVLEDLAKMSLADPSNPEELRLGKVAPVTFENVAHRDHKWQVDTSHFKEFVCCIRCCRALMISALLGDRVSSDLFRAL